MLKHDLQVLILKNKKGPERRNTKLQTQNILFTKGNFEEKENDKGIKQCAFT